MKNWEQYLIPAGSSITASMQLLNRIASPRAVLFAVDANRKLLGSVTDGDIRRGLLSGISMDESISSIMNTSCRFLVRNNYKLSDIEQLKQTVGLIPMVDESGAIIRLIDLAEKKSLLPIDAVIMAGGKGERLRPLTDNIPKPMLHVSGKPIIEYNVDNLSSYGIDHITISLGYLGQQIKDYFLNGDSKEIHIRYVNEEKPLGTFGALSLCQDFQHDVILIMNSDLLTNIDFEDFYRHFEKENADFSVACIPYKVNIPYAVMETNDYYVHSLKEKPTYTYYSNAGIYLMKRSLCNLLNENSHIHATDFIENLIKEKYAVVSYPLVSYWLDIGNPDDYKKAQEEIHQLKF